MLATTEEKGEIAAPCPARELQRLASAERYARVLRSPYSRWRIYQGYTIQPRPAVMFSPTRLYAGV